MDYKDYYKTMGLSKTASADDIKKAYRKLARKHHPDVSKDPKANEHMVALNEANAVLSDPERRMAYDTLEPQAALHKGQAFRPPPNWDSGFEFSSAEGDNGLHSEFFDQLFGRGARHAGEPRAARPGAAVRGGDHHASIELDLCDSYQGAERTVSLRSARLDAQGHTVEEERSLEVKIPKGVFEGQQVRLAGQGSPGHGGASAGDLLLEVRFKPDKRWRAQARDVYQPVRLSPWEAMLGTSTQVQTPSGAAEVVVPPGWKTGRRLRLKGRGIPGAGTHAAGDLYLELEMALPAADTEAARAAYAAMAQAFPAFEPRAIV